MKSPANVWRRRANPRLSFHHPFCPSREWNRAMTILYRMVRLERPQTHYLNRNIQHAGLATSIYARFGMSGQVFSNIKIHFPQASRIFPPLSQSPAMMKPKHPWIGVSQSRHFRAIFMKLSFLKHLPNHQHL